MKRKQRLKIFIFALFVASFLLGRDLKAANEPVIAAFAVPATSESLVVSVITFTATDDVAVVGYYLSESPFEPELLDDAWIPEAPSAYVFATEGTKVLYAWVKDGSDNISLSLSAQVVINLPDVLPVEETCYDNIQNQDETDIDCGGQCSVCVAETPVVPAIVQVQAAQVSSSSNSSSKKSSKKKKKKSSAKFSISNSKSKVTRGAVLIQRGSKFSKSSFVNLYFSKSGGGYYPPSKVMTSATGSFATSYRVSKPKGVYSWYAIDTKTGKRSKVVKYTIK